MSVLDGNLDVVPVFPIETITDEFLVQLGFIKEHNGWIRRKYSWVLEFGTVKDYGRRYWEECRVKHRVVVCKLKRNGNHGNPENTYYIKSINELVEIVNHYQPKDKAYKL